MKMKEFTLSCELLRFKLSMSSLEKEPAITVGAGTCTARE